MKAILNQAVAMLGGLRHITLKPNTYQALNLFESNYTGLRNILTNAEKVTNKKGTITGYRIARANMNTQINATLNTLKKMATTYDRITLGELDSLVKELMGNDLIKPFSHVNQDVAPNKETRDAHIALYHAVRNEGLPSLKLWVLASVAYNVLKKMYAEKATTAIRRLPWSACMSYTPENLDEFTEFMKGVKDGKLYVFMLPIWVRDNQGQWERMSIAFETNGRRRNPRYLLKLHPTRTRASKEIIDTFNQAYASDGKAGFTETALHAMLLSMKALYELCYDNPQYNRYGRYDDSKNLHGTDLLFWTLARDSKMNTETLGKFIGPQTKTIQTPIGGLRIKKNANSEVEIWAGQMAKNKLTIPGGDVADVLARIANEFDGSKNNEKKITDIITDIRKENHARVPANPTLETKNEGGDPANTVATQTKTTEEAAAATRIQAMYRGSKQRQIHASKRFMA